MTGQDFTGFFNTEYCVALKPKEEWRPVFHQDKEKLIAAMNRELQKIPGVIWNFSQPIQDNMEEAVSGIKGQLATKIYGDDLRVLEDKGQEIVNVMRHIKGIEDLGLFRVVGQPNLNFVVDRKQAARYQINVADVQDAIQTAVGGNALTQVLRGERALRPRHALSSPVPRHQGSGGEDPLVVALRRTRVSCAALHRWKRRMAQRRSIVRGTGVMWQSSTVSVAATSAAPSKKQLRR